MGLQVRSAMLRWRCAFVVVLLVTLGACGGGSNNSDPPAAPPAPPTAPTASLAAIPGAIDKGQSITLTWQTTNASSVSIEGI